eukprot:15116355-Alexandrium_andersonii.AAC.1
MSASLVGSEMCIRDRASDTRRRARPARPPRPPSGSTSPRPPTTGSTRRCLGHGPQPPVQHGRGRPVQLIENVSIRGSCIRGEIAGAQ